MLPFSFSDLSVGMTLVVFAGAAVAVWIAGTKISSYADVLADRTGLGDAFVGLLFLALATELPEIATTITAASRGQAELATSNIFGGIVLQTAVLVVADFSLRRAALTSFDISPSLLLQGVLLMSLLGLTLAGITAGEILTVGGVGLWTVALFLAYLGSLSVSRRYEGREVWRRVREPDREIEEAFGRDADAMQAEYRGWSTRRLWLFFALGGLVILLAGVALARTSEVIAEKTGLGASFIGATLLATSTSLPELSTTVRAVRLGNSSMAISNIFGSNSIMVLLLFTSDLFYREGPILATVGPGQTISAAMGIVVTGIYLVGMLERRDKTIFRVGYDSVAVLLLYVGHLALTYLLR